MEESRGRSGLRHALGGALSTPDLQRLQLGWVTSAVAGWVVFIALAVHAYDVGRVAAGEAVVNEGDYGDRFYVVVQGSLDVTGERGASAALGVGNLFDEIALLDDVPRTATVTAHDDCLLYALDRESFLRAVSSHAFAARAARDVALERLAQVPVA